MVTETDIKRMLNTGDFLTFRRDHYPGMAHAVCGDCFIPDGLPFHLITMLVTDDPNIEIIMHVNAVRVTPKGAGLN